MGSKRKSESIITDSDDDEPKISKSKNKIPKKSVPTKSTEEDQIDTETSQEESWPKEDLSMLFDKIEAQLPKNDRLRSSSRANRLIWENVAFGKYSATECRTMWNNVQKNLRSFRLLKELIDGARDGINQPTNDHVKRKRHPDMPRRPLTSYIIFYMRHNAKYRKQNPQIDLPTLSKLIAEKFKNLPAHKKEKYVKLAAKEKSEYLEKEREFYQNHPELAPKPKREAGPKKPFRLYFESLLEKQSPEADKNAIMKKAKDKWKKMSNKNKLVWINKALAQTRTEDDQNVGSEDDFKKKLQNVLTKEEKLIKDKMAGKPDKPPTSAYRLFTKKYLSNHEEVQNMETKDRMTHISKKWKDCSIVTKNQLKEELKQLNEQYDKDLKQYLSTLTPEQRLQEELLLSKAIKPKSDIETTVKSTKSQIDDDEILTPNQSTNQPEADDEVFTIPQQTIYLDEPEPPPNTPFLLFASKKLKKNPNVKYTKKQMAQLWADLSIKQKTKYDIKFKELKTNYIKMYETFLKSLPQEDLMMKEADDEVITIPQQTIYLDEPEKQLNEQYDKDLKQYLSTLTPEQRLQEELLLSKAIKPKSDIETTVKSTKSQIDDDEILTPNQSTNRPEADDEVFTIPQQWSRQLRPIKMQ